MADKNVIVKVGGQTFRCEVCGANVFSKRKVKGLKKGTHKYSCNGCGEWYTGEE